MKSRRLREAVSAEMAAQILFLSDRTCCVCRVKGKPVQIHHIDDDPSNNVRNNLAVLCLDCHTDTQIRGGFSRKLDDDQVTLYRDDWQRRVARQRAGHQMPGETNEERSYDLELTTSLAEIYRENGEFELLAMFYDSIGNDELRDKYVELAIKKDPHDETISDLRILQGRPEKIPAEIIDREMRSYTENKDWSQRARFLKGLGRYQEAAQDYVQTALESLEDGTFFGAAFYLKELVAEGIIEELFKLALQKATKEHSLWWRVRALQELGWDDELKKLLLAKAVEIKRSKDWSLLTLLAQAQGNTEEYLRLTKETARSARIVKVGDP